MNSAACAVRMLMSSRCRPALRVAPCGEARSGVRTRLTDVHITSPLTNVDVVAAADTERVRPCKVAQIQEEADSRLQTLALVVWKIIDVLAARQRLARKCHPS